MNPTKIEYGERYSDDSGWERRIMVDTHFNSVELDLCGTHCHISTTDLWWLVITALQARERLGMDKLIVGECSPGIAEVRHE